MIIIAGTMSIRPEAVELLQSIAPAHCEHTMAETGSIFFSLGVADRDLGQITIVEIWVDEAAIIYHHQQPRTGEFIGRLGDAIMGLNVKVYDVAGERPMPELDTISHIIH